MRKLFVFLIVSLLLSSVCLADYESDSQDKKEKFRFYAGIAMVGLGLVAFWWTGTAIFFVVFASLGLIQIIEYMV